MGKIYSFHRTPETLYLKLIDMLNDFIKRMEGFTGIKIKRSISKTPSVEESLDKIASDLERIAFYLENQ